MKKILLIFLFSLSLVLAFSSTAIAPASDFTYVYGTVYDTETGEGIKGIKVTALCVNTTDTKSDPNTNDDGNYTITTLECSLGHTIIVTAYKDGVELGSNTDTVKECTDELGMCKSHVHVGISNIDIGIPEFPIVALPALLAMLSFGLIRKKLY